MRRLFLILALTTVIAGCAMDRNRNSSEREWARAECNNVIDREARQKCLRRVDEDWGVFRLAPGTKTFEAMHSGDKQIAIASVEALVAEVEGKTILVKGSRFMKMERVVAALTGMAEGGH